MVTKKDMHPTAKHKDTQVSNLYVINLMKSFKSRGYVTEKFSWNYYYWYLTNEGIEYLRDYLHLPEEIVPETLKKPRAPPRPLPGTGYDQRGPRRGGRYGDDKKFGGAPGDFNPSFVSSLTTHFVS